MSVPFIYLFLLIPIVAGILFNKQLTIAVLKDLRIERIFHYVLMSLLGFTLHNPKVALIDLFLIPNHHYLIWIFSLTYAAVFAIISNNIADVSIDAISNKERPLITNAVNKQQYNTTGFICLITAFTTSLLTDIKIFCGIICISVGYYLYSCPPLRLKQYTFTAKLIIGLNSLVTTVTGYVIAGGSITEFPIVWAIYILLPLSLAANFVDLKDINGDRLSKIKTLPVIWGKKKATHFIAFATFLSYIIPYLLIQNIYLLGLSIPMLIVHLYFLYKTPYREKPIFITYLLSLVGLIFFLL